MNKLVLVRGLPGSGKSTAANNDKYKKFIHCEADDYFYDEHGYYCYKPREQYTAHAFCQWKAFKAMQEGESVIVSNTFTTIAEMLPYIRFAQQRDILWSIVECCGTWKSIHNVTDEIIIKMKERWEESDLLNGEIGFRGINKLAP